MNVPKHLAGKRVGNNRIELVSLLGEGSYGAVYRAVLHRSGLRKPKHCAVKVLRTNIGESDLMCQRRELELHQRVSGGDGVVTLYESFKEGSYRYLVMKFCPDGDLWYWINKKRFLGNDILIKDVFTQILDATEYCHSHGVFHRDIKPENILLCNGGRKALLADFGLATSDRVSAEIRSGSPWYMSPECWGGTFDQPYATVPNDVWSLGILLLNLACGRQAPWTYAHLSDRFFKDFIKQPSLFRLFVPLSPEVHDILARVFVVNPLARISIKELRIAIQNVKHFAVPSTRLNEYRNYQRAVWKAIVSVPSPRPLPLKLDQNVNLVAPKADKVLALAAGRNAPPPALVSKSYAICNIGINKISPQCTGAIPQLLPPPSSSASSLDSDGPTTPDVPVSNPNDEAPEITITDISQGRHQFASPVIVPLLSPIPKLGHDLRFAPVSSWQSIFDAIGAL